MEPKKIRRLLTRYLRGTATPEEIDAVESWFARLTGQRRPLTPDDAEMIRQKLKLSIDAAMDEQEEEETHVAGTAIPPVILPNKKNRKWSVLLAAATMLGVIIAGWLLLKGHGPAGAPVSAIPGKRTDSALLPPVERATLTLADGSRIVLEEAGNGALAQQNGVKVIKLDAGRLAYNTGNTGQSSAALSAYNLLSTPRGGQYQVVLSDSTVVWLNSASSLRYPTAFTGATRQVELTGEGYFEVARNKDKPFRVVTGDQVVDVLGTRFNIMAYPDEAAIRTTLRSGSVSVAKGKARTLLIPGKQAVLGTGAGNFETVDADLESTIAWKDGRFEFDETDIAFIMRQIERWYDVKVAYGSDLSGVVLSGSISRRKTVATLLDLLAKTGRVHFRLDGNTVTVTR